jgi:alcohol dehydrogenase YqhD (iron-dependent ADH family)
MCIQITDRMTEATELQKVLTEYGCLVKTRLGLHEASESICSKKGLLILELVGAKDEWDKLETAAKAVKGIEVKHLDFEL